jgi:hypothetical protein
LRPAEASMPKKPGLREDITQEEFKELLATDPPSDQAMPPHETRPEAGSFLYHLLQVLLFDYGGDDPAVGERERLIDLIALFFEYVQRSGADANFASRDKLARFMYELDDLNDGVPSPTFKAKKLDHGPRLSSGKWRSRTTIAGALDLLIKAKFSEEEALDKVSKIPGIEKLLSGKTPNKKKSPLNWRAGLVGGSYPTDLVREQWEASRKFIDIVEMTVSSPSEKRKILEAEAMRLIAAAPEEIERGLGVTPTLTPPNDLPKPPSLTGPN